MINSQALTKIIPSFFFITIISLGLFSGVYTFSGIGLLIDNKTTALILAGVIQVTIITTILSFPFVSGFFPKSLVLIIYLAFLFISIGTAYIYIFNQQASSGDVASHDITFISEVSKYIAELDRGNKALLLSKEKETKDAERLMNEEKEKGGRSGAGPGEGTIFYKKQDKYETLKISYEQEQEKYEIFHTKFTEIKGITEKESSSQNYASAILRINEIDNLSTFSSPKGRNTLDRYIDSLKSPVEKAIDPLLQGDYNSISLISSIVWSSLFDLASFVIGFIYINKNKAKKTPFIDRVVNICRAFYHGVIRIKNIKDEVTANKIIVHEGKKYEIDVARLYRFGARLIAVTNAVKSNTSEALDPLKLVVSKLQILNFSKASDPDGQPGVPSGVNSHGVVGILNSDVESHSILKAVVAFMHLEKLFIINKEFEAYELNQENEVALDMVVYLLNNSHVMDNSSLKEYYPRLVHERYEVLPVDNTSDSF